MIPLNDVMCDVMNEERTSLQTHREGATPHRRSEDDARRFIEKDNLVLRFCLYGAIKNLQFFEAFLIIILIDWGYNLFQIGLLQSIIHAFTYIFEVPSGVIADQFGKKNELLLCFVFYIISFVLYALGELSFTLLVFASVFYGLGEAFRSGTHKAMIMVSRPRAYPTHPPSSAPRLKRRQRISSRARPAARCRAYAPSSSCGSWARDIPVCKCGPNDMWSSWCHQPLGTRHSALAAGVARPARAWRAQDFHLQPHPLLLQRRRRPQRGPIGRHHRLLLRRPYLQKIDENSNVVLSVGIIVYFRP